MATKCFIRVKKKQQKLWQQTYARNDENNLIDIFSWTVSRAKVDSTILLEPRTRPYLLGYLGDNRAAMFEQFYWLNKEIYFEPQDVENANVNLRVSCKSSRKLIFLVVSVRHSVHGEGSLCDHYP